MSRATELAEWLETSNSSVDVDAAKLLRQQEAVIKQCVEALKDVQDFRPNDKCNAALAAAKECLK